LGTSRANVKQVRGLFGLAGDDQRRPRLVDEDVVDLVHDRERSLALTRPSSVSTMLSRR
jgi:hypothetical protein